MVNHDESSQAMPRLAATLTDSQYDWVESESKSRGCSMAQVIRDLIDVQQEDESDYESEEPYDSLYDEMMNHREQMEQLESRITTLERKLESVTDSDIDSDNQSASETTERKTWIQDVELNSLPDSFTDDILAKLEGDGRSNRTRLHQEAIQTAVWLRDQDERVTKSDFVDALGPDDLAEDTWWDRYARPALQQMRSQGLVEYREGHHDYTWRGVNQG